jgi:hypothetical protein
MTKAEPFVHAWLDEVRAWSGEELAARLTFLTLLFSPIGDWYVSPVVQVFSAIGLLFRNLWRSAWLWLVLTLLAALRVYQDWPMADNHAYLLVYWCAALAIATGPGGMASLARNARWLIGLTFAFAAWQKWASPDYANDVFFLTTFLVDERFEDFAVLFGGLTYEQLEAARVYLEGDYRAGPVDAFPFELPVAFRVLARLSTIWNLLEQTLVAVAFLAPPASIVGRLRDPLLLLFCFTVYAVAPVPSFGWLLIAMAVVQAMPSNTIRVWYLTAFATLAFYYEVPWAWLLVEALDLG